MIGNFESGRRSHASTGTSIRKSCSRIIDAKIAGEEVVATAEEAPPKVVNLMDALRQSLDRVSTGKKKSAKADFEKPVKAAAPAARRSARRAEAPRARHAA